MGMDDVFHSMDAFEKELEVFNQKLQASFKDLNNQHEKVSPLWDDSMRKEYDEKWIPLEEDMKEYVTKDGRTYVDILISKLTAIRGYLYGS